MFVDAAGPLLCNPVNRILSEDSHEYCRIRSSAATLYGEKARLTRAYDYLILVLALFLFIGAFHLHVALTAGDWDFWQDWKDRQWWPLVTPLMMIT
jgi:hypothetical protein